MGGLEAATRGDPEETAESRAAGGDSLSPAAQKWERKPAAGDEGGDASRLNCCGGEDGISFREGKRREEESEQEVSNFLLLLLELTRDVSSAART